MSFCLAVPHIFLRQFLPSAHGSLSPCLSLFLLRIYYVFFSVCCCVYLFFLFVYLCVFLSVCQSVYTVCSIWVCFILLAVRLFLFWLCLCAACCCSIGLPTLFVSLALFFSANSSLFLTNSGNPFFLIEWWFSSGQLSEGVCFLSAGLPTLSSVVSLLSLARSLAHYGSLC